MTKTYKPKLGEEIKVAVRRMIAMAQRTGDVVVADINGITLKARPDDKPGAIVKRYQAKSARRHEIYVKSPEYKKRKRAEREARRRHNIMLKKALAAAPKKMTLRDEKTWNKMAANNTDAYGHGIITFAEQWARLMEAKIANGDTLEKCAEETCSLADDDITGHMYKCAVLILTRVWIHGDHLRSWYRHQWCT